MRPSAVAWSLAATLVLCGPSGPARAAEVELGDLDARIEYAYYAADLRLLDNLVDEQQALATASAPWAAYQYAHAQFRRARLLQAAGSAGAAQAAARLCLQALGAPGVTTPDIAELRILSAACEGYVSHGGSAAVERALAAAQDVAPRNPRLLLARAFRLVASGSRVPPLALRQQQLAAARAAAAAFAEPTATPPGAPSWGGPEAWLLVGSRAEALGDWLAAREAYERCLVLAPDYVLVRSRLAALRGREQ